MLRRARVGVLDHLEQRIWLFTAIHGPAGIEDLVPAVFGIGLREHHQFDIGRITAELAVALPQVLDLVGGQRQAQALVGLFQLVQRDPFGAAARGGDEQCGCGLDIAQQRLRHRVVQQVG